jgi:c-di-GMP-binding flagellar brake protein YcgR
MFEDTQPAPIGADGHLDALAEFRIDHPREIAAVMRQLMDASAAVHLSTPDGVAMSTVLWTVDSAQRRLVFAADSMHPQLQPLAEASEVTAVSYLDAVKLQFDLADVVLVRGTQQCTLAAALPREIYRFQRRNTFRVRTLERHSPTARFRHPALPDMGLALRVLDVSIGGCALFLPEDVPPLPAGVDIQGAVIELDAETRFAATLRLHHVTVIQPTSRGSRLGCELMHMDGLAQRGLQRYIDQTQKRRRLMSLS